MAYVKKIRLNDFRGFKTADFSFAKTTAIIGKNGTGKTNIIEAIRLMSIQKSFRADREKELIRFGAPAARVEGEFIIQKDKVKMEIGLDGRKKQVKVNGVFKKVSFVVGLLKTVLFSASDLSIIEGPPKQRRRFINQIICQLDQKYLTALLRLKRILRQRNALLSQIASRQAGSSDLAIWDEQLVEVSALIEVKRLAACETLNNRLTEKYNQLAGSKEKLEIKYHPSLVSKEGLKESLERDLFLCATTSGPHHGELLILLNQKSLSAFGSRGEWRSAILALKQAEVNLLSVSEPPVLLLDDVFSELDSTRQKQLATLVENQPTILTSTYLPEGMKEIVGKVIEL